MEDDHGRNTHLCQSRYSLRITAPDGSTTNLEEFTGNDDRWDRPIEYRIEGFTAGDHALIGLVTERGEYPMMQVFLYEPGSGTVRTADLYRSFKRVLSSTCRASLRVIGTADGGIVLSSGSTNGCPIRQQWSLQVRETLSGQSIASRPHLLPVTAKYSTLEQATTPF